MRLVQDLPHVLLPIIIFELLQLALQSISIYVLVLLGHRLEGTGELVREGLGAQSRFLVKRLRIFYRLHVRSSEVGAVVREYGLITVFRNLHLLLVRLDRLDEDGLREERLPHHIGGGSREDEDEDDVDDVDDEDNEDDEDDDDGTA